MRKHPHYHLVATTYPHINVIRCQKPIATYSTFCIQTWSFSKGIHDSCMIFAKKKKSIYKKLSKIVMFIEIILGSQHKTNFSSTK